MAEPSVPASSRRTVLACAGAACAAVLAGCSKYNSNNGGIAGSQPAPATSSSAAQAAPAGSGSGAAAAGPAALASTADIPVGGGKILAAKQIVITQPKSGEFHGFSAVCTHAGCIVGTVSGGTINCPCHGSRFSNTNGSVVNGPAASPLPQVGIKVQGNAIFQA